MTINLSFDQIIKTILKPLVFLIDHHIGTVYINMKPLREVKQIRGHTNGLLSTPEPT